MQRKDTPHQQAQQQVRESEERLRMATEAARMFVWDCDLAARTILWSDNTAALLGCRPEELPQDMGRSHFFVDPEDSEHVLREYEEAVARRQETYTVELRGRGAAGPDRRYLAQARIQYDPQGVPVRVIGVTQDITERKRAEEVLAETARSLVREREKLEVALRAGQLGVYEWRVGETSVWWSQEVYAVYGVEPGTFTPTVESFGALVHPDDREGLWQKTEECIARREVFTHEYRILRPDGTVRWIANLSRVGLDAAGEVERITGVAMDITERKQAEQVLREADRQKDEFLATLSHELRNPLAPISNALHVLAARGASDPGVAWAQDVIGRQLRQMSRLLDDLLDVSRITRGKVELRTSRVTLGAVVDSAVETSRPLIEEGGHELAVALPEEPVPLDADPVRLAQVFSNLLNNAAKYTPNGGRIHLTAERQGGQVAVSVKDSGIGIVPEMLPRVFEMFSQAEPARERSRGGLGIGLSLARRLVEMHGGSIEARSDGPGRGSDFVVRLPAAAEETAADTASRSGEDGQLAAAKRRLLIVDDLKDSADSLAMLLEMMGHEVHTAYDGEEAVAAAEKLRPEVILLDLGMPKMNGYDACRHIRQQPWGQGMLVVALTGWGQEDDRRRTGDAGFDSHLVKPVDADALLKVLASR